MSKIGNGILGVVAGALALGAVHLDNARSGTLPALAHGDASLGPLYNVQRASKADRLGVRENAEASATMFVYPVAMPDMLIAARVIRSKAAPARKSPKPSSEPMIACEPLMSVLAVEAANLQPGRCLA